MFVGLAVMGRDGIVVGVGKNYLLDKQHSMYFYGQLVEEFLNGLDVRVVSLVPPTFFGGHLNPVGRVEKYLRYVDKLILPALSFPTKRIDVLHIVDHNNASYSMFTRAKHVIVTCHDLIPILTMQGKLDRSHQTWLGRCLARFQVKCLEAADVIVCVSATTRRDLLSNSCVDPNKAIVIHLPLRPLQPRLPASEQRDRLRKIGNLEPKGYFLNVSGLAPYKNRPALLNAHAQLKSELSPNVRLVIVGPPPQGATLNGDVRYLEDIDDNDLGILYTNALCYACPSTYEGFGWPIIEAQSCGCPVVCSDGGALPEVVGNGGIIFPADNNNAFKHALLQVARSPEVRRSLVERGYANLSRFSAVTWRNQHQALYAKLFAGTEDAS